MSKVIKHLLFVFCFIMITHGVGQALEFSSPTPNDGAVITNDPTITLTHSDSNQHYVFSDFGNALAGWWRGQDGVTDDSAQANVTTWVGTPAYISGKFGQAFNLSGTNHVSIADNDALDASTFTASIWVRYTGASPQWNRIFSKKEVYSDNSGWEVTLWSGSNTDLYVAGSTSNDIQIANCVDDWTAGAWHHLAMVYEGGSVKVYCDGQLKTGVGSISPVLANSHTLNLGCVTGEGTGNNWVGQLDEALIINRALSQAEIASLYNAVTTPYSVTLTQVPLGNNTLTAFGTDLAGVKYTATPRSFSFQHAPVAVVANPPAGTYYATQTVALSSFNSASIVYADAPIPAGEHCAGPTGTSYSSALTVDASQTLYVRACNEFGDTDSSLAYELTEAPLPTPTISGTNPGNGQINLYYYWDMGYYAGVIATMRVQYRVQGTSDWSSVDIAGNGWGTAFSYDLTGLNSGTDYELRVALMDDQDLVGTYSQIVADRTITNGPLAVDFFGNGRSEEASDWYNSNGSDDAYSMYNPSGVALDSNHHRLFVADGYSNSRIMVFNLNEDNSAPDHRADAVIYSVLIDEVENYLSAPRNVLYDNLHDRLYIADSSNGRVLVLDGSVPLSPSGDPSNPVAVPTVQYVLGAGDFYYPLGMTLDSVNGRLFVAEKNKQKGSVYGSINVFDVREAGSPQQSMCGVTSTGLGNLPPSCTLWIDGAYAPRDLAYNANQGVLYIAYADENRILVADVRAEASADLSLCDVTSNGLPASDETALIPSCVLGQSNLESTNSDTSASTLYTPRGLWYDSVDDDLYVADLNNYRVLQYSDLSGISNGMAATGLFGQGLYTDSYSYASRVNLYYPNAVTVDPVHHRLYVSDNSNSRIMVFALNSTNLPVNPGPTALKFATDINDGFLGIAGLDPSNTASVSFLTDYTITANAIEINFPVGTVMTQTGGGNLDLTSFVTTIAAVAGLSDVKGAVRLGIPALNLSFSQAITVRLPVAPGYNGQALTVYYQREGSDTWQTETQCVVADDVCVFSTTHATTFAAQAPSAGNGSSNNSSASSSVVGSNQTCATPAPDGTPDLFQIDVTGTSAKLFFTPASSSGEYVLRYGSDPQNLTHGVEFNVGTEGVQNFTVHALAPRTTYHFQIRAQQGCATGAWSNSLSAKSSTVRDMAVRKYYKNSRLSAKGRSGVVSSKVGQNTGARANISESPALTPSPSPTLAPAASAPPAPQVPSPKAQKCFLWWCFGI